MSAGQVWRRPDGLRWVEVQALPAEASGWRLMIPLVEHHDAPDAPPLVVALEKWRARVHLLCSAPHDLLDQPEGQIPPEDVEVLRAAARSLVGGL